MKTGAKDFISKPFDQVEVKTRIHNMLEVRLLYQSARHDAQHMESLALQDPLTGLANRRLLEDRMWSAMAHARRNGSAMAVVCLDLDGFKQINDRLGHGTGDALLKMVAARLLATVREEDTVARQGGDEFMIVMWQISNVGAVAATVSKIIKAVAHPYVIEGHALSITTSAGASLYTKHGEDVDTLMASADLALYEAKRAGKNTFRISHKAVRPVSAGAPALRGTLRPATVRRAGKNAGAH